MRRKYLLAGLILCFSLFPPSTSAQEKPASSEQAKRITERSERIKPQLTQPQQKRLQERCSGAQTKILKFHENAQKFNERHDKKFNNFIEKTTKLIARLKDKGLDTAKIEGQLATAQTQYQRTEALYNQYIAALDDAAKIDCKADPSGFKSALEDARNQAKELKKSRDELRKTVKEQIKDSLKGIAPKTRR